MAKGQLHSTGTICKAEIRCPIEADGGQHFDSVDELVSHTSEETGADVAELRSVLATGVSPAEAVSMAREGVLGGSTPQSLSREPKVPATIEIDLSSASSSALSERFLENLREVYLVSSVKDDGTGRLTVVVEAESDPDDYSVLMAADTAARNAATDMGYDEDEMEEFEENFTVHAELNEASPQGQKSPTPPVKYGDRIPSSVGSKDFQVVDYVDPEPVEYNGGIYFRARGGFEGPRGGKLKGEWRALIPAMESFSDSLSISAKLDPVSEKSAAPKKPAEVKELSDFDPSVHSVFSNAAARKDPAVAAKALKRELAHGDWMAELAERHEDAVSEGSDMDLFPEASLSVKESEARQSAMAREMKWLADNDESYAAKLPRGVRGRLDELTEQHRGVSIGTVRKAPAPKA